jgi:glycosyltransferase involved in cell wall biosynthesis
VRVLLVNSLLPPVTMGGAEESVLELARDLGAAGYAVTVATLGPTTGSVAEPVLPNVSIQRLATPVTDRLLGLGSRHPASKLSWHLREGWRPLVTSFLRAAVERARPDVVHTHSIAGFGTAAWQVHGRRPLVHTLRDYYLLCASSRTYSDANGNCATQCRTCRLVRTPQRVVAARPDVFVGISEAVLARHRDLGYLSPDARTAVVRNQPDVPTSSPAGRPTTAGGRAFGFIGRLEDYKGLWKALDAFRAVPGSEYRFVVAGDGDEAALSSLRERMAADDRIVYLGRVDKRLFYAQVDVVVVPSQWHEPYGRAAGEAVQAGRQVLVSGIGGLPEAVDGSGLGHVVADYASVPAWTAAMTAALDKAPDGAPGRAPGPVVPSVAEQYVELYRSLLEGRPGASSEPAGSRSPAAPRARNGAGAA